MNKCTTHIVLLAAMLAVAESSIAQTVIAADEAQLQPLIYREGAEINGCGLRGIVVTVTGIHSATVVDFSVTVRTGMNKLYGIGKAGAFTSDPQKEISTRRQLIARNFLIAIEDGSATAAPDKFIKADTPGFILGGIAIDDAAKILSGLQQGDRMQIGILIDGEELQRIYSFNATISDPNRNSFFACMNSFFKTANDNIEKMEAK